jgi:cation:H+ antiporter
MALSVPSLLPSLALGAVGVVALWVGARTLVAGASHLARRAGVPELVVGLTVVAVGTSAPELVVTVNAALVGRGDVAVGNVLGSNVYNLAFILGAVAVVRVVPVEPTLFRRDATALVVSTVALGVAGTVRAFAVSPAAVRDYAWLVGVVAVVVALLWTGRALSRREGVALVASELARWALDFLG